MRHWLIREWGGGGGGGEGPGSAFPTGFYWFAGSL